MFSPAGNGIHLDFWKASPQPQTFPEKQTAHLTYEEAAEHRSWNPHSIPGHHAKQPRGGQKKKSIFDEHHLEKDQQRADEAQRMNFSGFLTHEINCSLGLFWFIYSIILLYTRPFYVISVFLQQIMRSLCCSMFKGKCIFLLSAPKIWTRCHELTRNTHTHTR